MSDFTLSTAASKPVVGRMSRAPKSLTKHSLLMVLFVAWLAMVMPVAAKAEDVAGRVISVTGDVVAARPEQTDERPLDRRDSVLVQDVVITRQDSRTQIRFQDEGLIDLRPNSQLEVATYEISDDPDEPSRAVMNFTEGALRTITGSIGSEEGDEYRMETSVASIGIRGTDYALQYCDTNCPEGADPDGLYGRVNEGIIVLTNEVGTFELRTGENFFLLDNQSVPEILSATPEGILDGTDDGETGDDDDEEDEEAEAAVSGQLEVAAAASAGPVETDDDDDVDPMAFLTEPGGVSDLDDDGLEDLLTDPVIERVMAGVYGNEGSYGDRFLGGLIRQAESDDTGFVTGDGNVVTSAQFDGEAAITDTGEEPTLSGTGLWFDNAESAVVYWGKWSNTSGDPSSFKGMDQNGDEFESRGGDFHFVFSEYPTESSQLTSISGLTSYENHTGSEFFMSKERNFSSVDGLFYLRDFKLSVDFDDLKIDHFEMDMLFNSGFNREIESIIESGDIDIDSLYALEFDVAGNWNELDEYGFQTGLGGDVTANFEGQFIGVDADGIIYFIDMELLDQDDELHDLWIGSGLMTSDSGHPE